MRKMNVELKAKVVNLQNLRARLAIMKAKRIGLFRQVDTYFLVPEGRLKIRESNRDRSQLVYYSRENTRGPKVSDVLLADLPDPKTVKTVLASVLGIGMVVCKEREMFRLKGVQVHLDKVKHLGSFIEFEKVVDGTPRSIRRAKDQLSSLLKGMSVPQDNLQEVSYAELLNRKSGTTSGH